jgi:hypothetical protein
VLAIIFNIVFSDLLILLDDDSGEIRAKFDKSGLVM